ncbi:MAG TPA: GTPase HflX [Oceanospirillales bacterium]|nr:GTPase HflX [Oceanospirillales bacterium]
MFERSKKGNHAILVCPVTGLGHQEKINEFSELALSAGATILDILSTSRKIPEARYFIGSGNAQKVADLVSQHQADLVLVDVALSPVQERNLEKLCQCRVLDRTSLILDIFSQRARSYEGMLQVELAQLRHLATRLVRGWTHLERQKGGIGMRGPGETQLETDRRLLAIRVKSLKNKLNKVIKQREQGRNSRKQSGTKMIAFVGYTNAGKSTLFNHLTQAKVYAADQLFATLDPTVRKLHGITGTEVVVSDTVGFVRDLPHDLVAAFQATLQEAIEADLLVHVIDSNNPEQTEHISEVNTVLKQIKADKIPAIEVYNKIDLSGIEAKIKKDGKGQVTQCWLSAQVGNGIEMLRSAIEERFNRTHVQKNIHLPAHLGKLRAIFYQWDAIREDKFNADNSWSLKVELPPEKWKMLAARNDECGHFVHAIL